MNISEKGIALLRKIEELRTKPYNDHTGQPISSWVPGATIGYGHLIRVADWGKFESGVSPMEAEVLLRDDLQPFVHIVNQKIHKELDLHKFDALVILAYNIGPTNFSRSSVVKIINDPLASTPYPSLRAAWKAWNKSRGVEMDGLNNRRNCEWAVFSKGIYEWW